MLLAYMDLSFSVSLVIKGPHREGKILSEDISLARLATEKTSPIYTQKQKRKKKITPKIRNKEKLEDFPSGTPQNA